ncbi:MAG: mRNA splicing protein [Vezdaea aestivalis]|nr:MAG: mRNA splicing protein [Vezdaea aestivalis]
MPPKAADVASKERNEYIPNYISKKPFWFDESTGGDYLDHQRLQNDESQKSTKWYDRGQKLGPAATKYRKGACENCGALTHKTKECLSRPRKLGARWTGKDIQADEVVQEVKMGWDAKRDRWNGYDAAEYKGVIDEFEEMEKLRKEVKKRDAKEGEEGEDDEEEEEAKYAEESDMGRQQSTATRNLRLREDTAKYLVNLDLDSARYDPKTRSMVDMGAVQDKAAALVAEENFMRASGDAAEFERAQKYAWESQERGDKNKVHLQANPTSGEYFQKKAKVEAEARRDANRKALLSKYGGEQHLQAAPLKDAAILENERYVEYDELGLVKGAPKLVAKSKYAEDVLINNHTSVWGSWWEDFKWGYQCCHSTTKNSYCTGETGKKAFAEAKKMKMGGLLEAPPPEDAKSMQDEVAISDRDVQEEIAHTNSDKVKKKRTLQEMQSGVGEEEMEEYQRKRTVANDPMAKLLGKDELVH